MFFPLGMPTVNFCVGLMFPPSIMNKILKMKQEQTFLKPESKWLKCLQIGKTEGHFLFLFWLPIALFYWPLVCHLKNDFSCHYFVMTLKTNCVLNDLATLCQGQGTSHWWLSPTIRKFWALIMSFPALVKSVRFSIPKSTRVFLNFGRIFLNFFCYIFFG